MHPIDAFGHPLAWMALAYIAGRVTYDILRGLAREQRARKEGLRHG